jgi:segregation and condensation protein A
VSSPDVEPHGGAEYHIKVEGFEGPLDLLLQIIRKHELDILDIPVGFITEKYLEYLQLMETMQIDVASEYLVMAATLVHIKSKMLLPPDPNAAADDDGASEDEGDPRAELVRRLLEYQKYKEAAAQLGGRATLGRDVFARGAGEPVGELPAPLAPVGVFKLFDAFERVLARAKQVADHQVLFERMSITERIVELTELLDAHRRMRFEDLFVTGKDGQPVEPTRFELVVTFLALLEMGKMRIARVFQDAPLGELWVELHAKHLDGSAAITSDAPDAPAAVTSDGHEAADEPQPEEP